MNMAVLYTLMILDEPAVLECAEYFSISQKQHSSEFQILNSIDIFKIMAFNDTTEL